MRFSLFWKTHIKDNFLCKGIASMEKNMIRKGEFYQEKNILFWKETFFKRRKFY